MRMCHWKRPGCKKCFPHSSHWYGFSHVCVDVQLEAIGSSELLSTLLAAINPSSVLSDILCVRVWGEGEKGAINICMGK